MQGVWFRAHTVDKAKALGVVGFVMNTPQVTMAIQIWCPIFVLVLAVMSRHTLMHCIGSVYSAQCLRASMRRGP